MIELLEFAPNEQVVEAIDEVQASWRIYSLKVLSYPNKTMGSVLFKLSSKILNDYDDLLILLEKQTEKEGVRLINLAGRQAMLAQRMEMLYLAQDWGLANKGIFSALKDANEEFEETQNLLLASNMNKPQMVERLNSTLETWRFLKGKFGNVPSPLAILDMTSAIQDKLLEIAAMYTELTKQVKVDNDE